jgi:UDP-N-acetylmuramoylalanine-D-glutamate ligase
MINLRFNQSKNRREISLQQDSFTPCKHQISLLEPLTDAAENAARHATILLSPALSSLDGFQNARDSGEKLYRIVESISRGQSSPSPNMNG